MSYLQLDRAPIPNMTKGIISLWFKGAAAKAANAPEESWPFKGPPDRTTNLPLPVASALVFWDLYGEKTPFGIRSPPPMIHPLPPVTHLHADVPAAAILPHDKFNILMSFGDPDLEYAYRPWVCKQISEYPGVLETPPPFVYEKFPPPYRAHFKIFPTGPLRGQPIGIDGKIPVCNIQLAEAAEPAKIIPQSFIGLTSDKELRILLQTDTKATYQGYMYTPTKAKELFAQATIFHAPTTSPPRAGFWGYIGPYWAGWQFTYQDTSEQLMTAWPEFFMINGPRIVDDDKWNHLLLSFDISGKVSLTVSGLTPNCTTECRAWLAVNDVNVIDYDVQDYPGPPPYLPEIPPDLNSLPYDMWSRSELGLGSNDIVPENVFLHGQSGNPRENLPRAYAADLGSGVAGFCEHLNPYAYLSFLGLGGGPGIVDPVTVPDPKMFATPSYECSGFSIPTHHKPLGLPAASPHVSHVRGAYMAELQMWVDKTLDTSVLTNRRLFIAEDGKPVSMDVAEKVLGKPDIVLHGTSRWQDGFNTGSSGVSNNSEGDQEKLPEGQFTPVGKIDKYEPDPDLSK